jgi:hypothetical protein
LGVARLELGGNVGPKIALVDAEDWGPVSLHCWWPVWQTRALYWNVFTKISGRKVPLQRFLLPDSEFVVHLNRDQLDNRRANLREVGHEGLNAHRGPVAGCAYKGVTYDPERRNWRARLKIKGQWVNLGRHATPEDAAKVYDAAAFETWGEVAYLNFPQHRG